MLNILNNYNLVILGDREFHSIHLAHWLQLENNRRKNQINFAFRQKKNTQIGQENGSMVALKNLLVVPGIKHFFKSVKVTKTFQKKGFNVGVYQKRKYFQKTEHEPWYILTNLPTAEEAISAYKKRWSIEAMFKDSKSGGYNLQNTKASIKRSECLILLIAIAYISSTLKGVKIKNKQVQKYTCRLQDKKRKEKRHSSFWVGFYGESWVKTWDFLKEEIEALMVLNPDKLKYYLKGLRAMSLIQAIQT